MKDFAKDILKIETEILIVEAKKIVRQGNPSVNHIIARLADCQMANDIKTSMYKLPRKSHRYGVEEDLPKDWQEKWQKCYEQYVKPAKIARKKVRWSGPILYIDDHKVNTENETESWMQPMANISTYNRMFINSWLTLCLDYMQQV